MTPQELLEELERRGVLVEPEGPDMLAVEPMDALSPAELEALRRAKPEVLRLLRQRQRLSPWPDRIGGHPRTLGPLGRCRDCPPDPPAPRPALSRSRTWVRYGDALLCLAHALAAEAHERRPS
jgi:hypothetical protein